MQVNQHMRGVSPSLKVQPGPSRAQHHHVRPAEALTCPAPQAAHLPSLSFSVLVVASVSVKVVIPLFVVKLHQTPSLRKCVFSTLNAVWAAGNKHQAICSLTGVCGSSTELAVLSLAWAALGMWDHFL